MIVDRARESFFAPMSFAQQRLWTLDRISGGSATYNVPRALRIRGPLDVRAFRLALGSIVARHEILRTRFDLIDGEPMQVVAGTIEIPFDVVDLESLDPDKRARRTTELLEQGAARVFDLATGPLVRVTLMRFDANDHIALIAMHHIVTDEWSNAIFNRELGEFYEAALTGASPDTSELSIQYADYAHWQRDILQGRLLEEELAFWRGRLAGAPPRTELRAHERRDAGSDAGRTHSFTIPAATARRLHGIGAAHGTTPFMTLLATFYVLLYRYTGQADLVVGSPIAHRDAEELESLIGFFINTLPLRTQFDPKSGFVTVLERVRETALAAFTHQVVPFERIVADLNVARTGAETPLVNVFFQVDDGRSSPLRLAGVTVEPVPLENPSAKFDLSLAISDRKDGLLCSLTYKKAAFEANFIARMADNFATLLASIVEQPERAIAELPLLAPGERQRVIEEFNATAVDYPRDETVLDLLERQARLTPSAIALEWDDDDDRSQTLDFAELHRRADDRAKQLRALGVGPNVGVGICLSRSADLVISVVAVFKAGGYYVPLDPDYPPQRLAFMLEDSRVTVLLTHSSLASNFADRTGTIFVDVEPTQPVGSEAGSRRRANATDFAYMIYTSGSTGRPKGALNRHEGIVNRLRWMQDRYRASERDVVLHKTSFSFDVSVWELLWPLAVGSRLLLARSGGQRDPSYLIGLIVRHDVTLVHFVPSMLRLFVTAESVDACTSLRHVIASGEELPADLVALFYAKLPAGLHNLYGPTEAAIDVTHYPCPRDFSGHTVPIGWPVANTQMYVLDRDMQPVPLGVAGELFIGGIQVGAGYFNRPELTAQRFVTDPFQDSTGRLYRTGDLARANEDGSIEFLGRLDTQVKLNGIRIELGEIESVLRRQPDVRDAAVVVRGEQGAARIVAYVVSDDAAHSPESWHAILTRELPSFMVPHIIRLPKLPLTPNGKLDYKALPEPGQNRAVVTVERTNMLHHQLIGMWEAALRTSPIGVHENFFTLGGDSLAAVRLVADMSRTFDRPLRLSRFFEDPTIAHIADLLLEEPTEFLTSPLVALQPQGTKTPFFFIDGDLHGGGYYVRGLARRLGDERPLFALHMPGTQGRLIPATIEAAAAELLQAIRSARPHGPYILGGFCNGGLIAYEIARMLQAAGENVEHLVILEAYCFNAKLTRFADPIEAIFERLGWNVSQGAVRTTIARSVFQVRRIARLLRRLRRDPRDFLRRLARKLPAHPVEVVEDDYLESGYRELTIKFIPRRLRGSLIVLLVDQDDPLYPKGIEPSWKHVVDRVYRGTLPGTHLSCITRHIDETATAINEHLAKAET